jgi:predicted porin
MWDVGTIGGWGPTTSVMYRREATTSAPSNNCGNPLTGPNVVITSGSTPAAICYHADLGPAFTGSGLTGGNYALWRRYGSAVFYDSPMFSGFQFKIGYQPNETRSVAGITQGGTTALTTVEENPSSWSASLSWTGMGGKARAFIANMQAKDWTSIGHTDGGYIVGGGYNFGVVDIGAAYEAYNYKAAAGDQKTKDWAVGAAIPLGSGKIGVSYAQAADAKLSTGTVDNGAKMYNVGYEWALSKRTAVGFGYAAIKNDPLAAFTWTGMAPNQTGVGITPLNGSDVSNIFVAFRHSF